MKEINLIGGFYKSKTLPWSAQDVVNWVPVKSVAGGTRSPYKLRGLPGLRSLDETVVSELTISGNAPDTLVGATYSYSYSAAGGSPPYTFGVASGALPTGLSLSSAGAITGTPTIAQLGTFTVRVSDAQSQTADLPDTILVSEPASGYPTIISVTATLSAALETTHSADYPATVTVGDLLVYVVSANKGLFEPGGVNVDISTPSGLTKLSSGKPGGNTKSDTAVFYKVAAGTEGGTTVAFSVGNSARFTCAIYQIAAATYSGTPTVSAEVRSTDNVPNIASHNSGLTDRTTFLCAIAGESIASADTTGFPFADNNEEFYQGVANQAFVTSCSTTKIDGGSLSLLGNEFTLSTTANSYAYTLSIGA